MDVERGHASPGHGHFWVVHGWVPLLIFCAVMVWYHLFEMDFLIADHFFDFSTGRWRYGKTWWANQLLHDGGRSVIKGTAAVAFLCWAGSWKWISWQRWRRPAAYVLLVIGVSTAVVALGQWISPLHCPTRLARYDGELLHLSVWDSFVSAQPFGHCFPGKHASGGFSLLFCYFLLRDQYARLAWLGLVLGLAVGGLFSFAQMARGAHFFSHNWWSLGIDWAVAVGLYAIPFRQRVMP
jgi:membrane-associated PAP2 superfamily phosphatase